MKDVEHMDGSAFAAVEDEAVRKIVDWQHPHILQQRVSRRIGDAAFRLVGEGIESELHGVEHPFGGRRIVLRNVSLKTELRDFG